MKLIYQILVPFISFVYLLEVASTANKLDEPVLNPQWSYCFEFTWLGPNYDNSTKHNETCSDYLAESGAEGIPCNPPFVITYNGTFPDIDYLWKYHQSSIVCRRASGQVCARYAFYQNGAMANATYMCTKVQVAGEEPVEEGCFTQKIRDYEVEVCACVSGKGPYKPCNIHF